MARDENAGSIESVLVGSDKFGAQAGHDLRVLASHASNETDCNFFRLLLKLRRKILHALTGDA